ncbi:MAG TPA: dynamin family protein [Hyphomicrobiaceae bacterium]|nr:dynamin family protein [Hyphomicrobiaceae bacterium]
MSPANRLRRGSKLPCIAVAGEARSGKSSLINRLLGESVLPTGWADDPRPAILLRHASRHTLEVERPDGRREPADWASASIHSVRTAQWLRFGLPIELLARAQLIETPAFATGDDDVERCAAAACGKADAAIWCTPAVQAWKASEADAWLDLPRRIRARSILAVTYMDAVGDAAERARLEARIRAEAAEHFAMHLMLGGVTGVRQGGAHPNAGTAADLLAAVENLVRRLGSPAQRR